VSSDRHLGPKKVFQDKQRVTINERDYLLTPYSGPARPIDRGQPFEPASLITLVDAGSAQEAIDLIEPDFDAILDDLSFQIQVPLQICQHALVPSATLSAA
jgi:hypothetical protein